MQTGFTTSFNTFRIVLLSTKVIGHLQKPIKAQWSFKVIDADRRLVAFRDESIGKINKWTWELGEEKFSNEQHPIYQFKEKGIRKVITLTVEGSAGKSKRTRHWEVMIK